MSVQCSLAWNSFKTHGHDKPTLLCWIHSLLKRKQVDSFDIFSPLIFMYVKNLPSSSTLSSLSLLSPSSHQFLCVLVWNSLSLMLICQVMLAAIAYWCVIHCFNIDLSGNTGNFCNICAGLGKSLPGRTESLCVAVPVQHPQVPH